MDPITRCRFKVVIAGGSGSTSSELEATAIGAVQSSLGVAKLKKGAKTLTARSTESSVTVSRMRIEFNVGSPGWKDVITWWNEVNDFGKPLSKRNVEVIIYDGEEKAVQSILLEAAWPCRFGFMGGSTDGDTGPMGQYLDFISESFRIAATNKQAPASSTEKSSVTIKDNFKVDKIEIKTGDITGAKDSFKVKDSLKASGLAKVTGKATVGLGGGALSAIGALASLAKPAPKLSATATSSAIASNGNTSSSTATANSSADSKSEKATAQSGDHSKSQAASTPSSGAQKESHFTSTTSDGGAAPLVAAGSIVATATGAAIAGNAKTQMPSSPELTPSAPAMETASSEDGAGSRSGSHAGSFTDEAAETNTPDSPNTNNHSSSETASGVAAAAAMGAFSSMTQALKTRHTTSVPTIDLSGGTKKTEESPQKNSTSSSVFHKDSTSNKTEVSSETSAEKSGAQNVEDHTHATRSALSASSSASEKVASETGAIPQATHSTRIIVSKENFDLDRSAEKTRPIHVFFEETDKDYPDLIVRETGGLTEKTERTIRELVEKDLCAEAASKKGKSTEYRWCGKIIHMTTEKNRLVFRIRDEALRAALHDSLKSLFHAE